MMDDTWPLIKKDARTAVYCTVNKVKYILLNAGGFHDNSSLSLCSCPWSILWSYIQHKKYIIAPVGAREELRNERNIKREADCESDPEDWWVEQVNPHPSYLSL